MEIQLASIFLQGPVFNEVVRICEQGNKTLINCVGRSVQEYDARSLFPINRPSNIFFTDPLSVNKSIW